MGKILERHRHVGKTLETDRWVKHWRDTVVGKILKKHVGKILETHRHVRTILERHRHVGKTLKRQTRG